MDDGIDPVRLRFLTEARRVQALRAPAVLQILDAGLTKDGHPFLVREAPSGESLTSLLEALGSLPTESAVDVALAVCAALRAAHDAGIVHGEVSPAVIRLTWSPDGPRDVKLLDLGVARALAMLPLDVRAIESLAISAPEMLQSSVDPDARADIWGVGVLLYTMLAGAPPFASDSPSTVNLSVALDEASMLAGVPDALGDLVDACLARNPALRPQSMQALITKLAPFGSHPVVAEDGVAVPEDTGRYAAQLLESLMKKAASSEPPSEAASEPKVVASSIAPIALSVAPVRIPRERPAGAERKPRASRRTVGVAAACVAFGVLIGIGSNHWSTTPLAPSAPVQAAPPPLAEAPLPPVDPAPAPVPARSEPPASPAIAERQATPELTARPSTPAAAAPAPAPPSKPAVPVAVDPLVRSAAAPIHPVPKASDDLRRFLDDRR